MANSLDEIVRVVIDLEQPPIDAKSFNHLLVLGPPPAVRRNADGTMEEFYTPAVGVYNGVGEAGDAGFVTTGANADPLGAAARIAFSAAPSPEKIYMAVQQPAEFDAGLFAADVVEDVSEILDTAPGDAGKFLLLRYPATTRECVITKNGVAYEEAVSVTSGDVKYTIIDLFGESTGTFDIQLPEWESPQKKTISLEYVARWVNVAAGEGTEAMKDVTSLQLVNNSELEGVEETLSRAAGMDGWYILCPAGLGEEAYGDIAAWIESQEKMACFTRLRRKENILAKIWAFIMVVFGVAKKHYRSFEITVREDADPDNRYANVAYAAHFLHYQPGHEMWENKTLPGISPEFPNSTEKKDFENKNVSFYTPYAGRNIVRGGKVAGGEWIDNIRFRDWLKNEMQINIFALLLKKPKLPYTDKGINLIRNIMEATLQLAQGEGEGGIAPDEFNEDDELVPGYRVSVPLAASLTSIQRASRVLKGCTFTARLASAIRIVELYGALVYKYDD